MKSRGGSSIVVGHWADGVELCGFIREITVLQRLKGFLRPPWVLFILRPPNCAAGALASPRGCKAGGGVEMLPSQQTARWQIGRQARERRTQWGCWTTVGHYAVWF